MLAQLTSMGQRKRKLNSLHHYKSIAEFFRITEKIKKILSEICLLYKLIISKFAPVHPFQVILKNFNLTSISNTEHNI